MAYLLARTDHEHSSSSTSIDRFQMINERFTVLLSPPTSPHMADAAAKKGDLYNPYASQSVYQTPSTSSHSNQSMYGGVHDHSYDHSRPTLPSYNGLNHSLNSVSQSGHEQYGAMDRSQAANFDHHWDPRSRPAGETIDSHQATYSHSASASPVDRLTPRSPSNTKDQQDDDDLIEFGGDDQDDDNDKPPMTAAELRAQKRKMKRFRFVVQKPSRPSQDQDAFQVGQQR